MEEPQNSNGGSVVKENDDEPMIGPGPAPRSRPKRPLQFEQAYLDALPSANMYVRNFLGVCILFDCPGFRVYAIISCFGVH